MNHRRVKGSNQRPRPDESNQSNATRSLETRLRGPKQTMYAGLAGVQKLRFLSDLDGKGVFDWRMKRPSHQCNIEPCTYIDDTIYGGGGGRNKIVTRWGYDLCE
jgi:hypothetical protein